MKVLMIGAHQDDNEFCNGGFAKKLKDKGHDVRFLSLCNGGGGHHIMTFAETVAARAKESAKVAEILGIQYDVWSDMNDCTLVADLTNRRRLIRYIRSYNPDIVIAHRPNDYHADHRAVGQLVQDASYLLTVPHECDDVPAMRFMPIIMYPEDIFKNPVFRADLVIDIDSVIDFKLQIAHVNKSQVYEWLPYTKNEEVPEGDEERFEWLKGMEVTADTTDEEVLSAPRGYMPRFAKPAARHRNKLIEQFGAEKGNKIRFAEAYEVSEYAKQMTDEIRNELLSL